MIHEKHRYCVNLLAGWDDGMKLICFSYPNGGYCDIFVDIGALGTLKLVP